MTWHRNCAICWDTIHQCNGFVMGNPVDEPESCRELCGSCATLFMPELRELLQAQEEPETHDKYELLDRGEL